MASFETIASGMAQHAGTYVDALAVSGGLERAAEEPSRRPARPCGEAPRPTPTDWPNCHITAHPSGWTASAADGSTVEDSPLS
jgi:hypothetical protein